MQDRVECCLRIHSPCRRIPDLALVPLHPKRAFMRRAVEFEIRLSYYDRILRIIPEAMAEPAAQVMPDQAPGPEFEYEEPGMFETSCGIFLQLMSAQATLTTRLHRA